jgi:nicotinate-nucleotide--dimethylbenzimidazole phosphoribosyltransferase
MPTDTTAPISPASSGLYGSFIPAVQPLRQNFLDEAQTRLDSLTKPRGSLGRLEDLAKKLFAICRGQMPVTVSPALMLTVAADHGVAEQGVSPYPQSVSRQMVLNFLNGGAGINVLCRTSGMDLRIVDAGCAGGPFGAHEMLLDRRLGDGTADMSLGAAMSRETCQKGLLAGVELACEAANQGYRCLGVGEMGIANSTAGAALYSALLNIDPGDIVGPGAGSDAAMVQHKTEIVRRALQVNAKILQTGDAVDILAAVGGFEIAVMCGIMLGAASRGLPVLVDGYICGSAYAAAAAICPEVSGYCILSHLSAEPGHKLATDRLCAARPWDSIPPLLHLGMRLGEGTGGAVAYHLLRCAAAIYNDMATMSSAGVSGRM